MRRLAFKTLQMAVCNAVSLNPLVNHPFFITAVTLEGGASKSCMNDKNKHSLDEFTESNIIQGLPNKEFVDSKYGLFIKKSFQF